MDRQKGQAIVLIALMLTVLIGMVAIAIDGSRAYTLRRDLQAAVDAAALAAGDNLQQTGSWSSAEQVAASIFATNLRFYTAPGCGAWGSPGAAGPWQVTCNYSDGTLLTVVASGLGPQGGQFTVTARRNLQLQFARILTNGASPALAATSTGNVNNLRYTPAIAALGPEGCGGISGATISISGSGTLNVNGDIVSNGAVSLSGAAVRVAGDIYARCQPTVPGSVTSACFPSGASTPCAYPDVGGATRSGFNLSDPGYPAPSVIGGGQAPPNGNVFLNPGVYSSSPMLGGGHCWFLSGGVYDFQVGLANSGDFMSNELKPPDEPDPSDNTSRSSNQFWDTNSVSCSGSVQVTKTTGPTDIPTGRWAIVVTSVRTDVYNGVSYQRESAPSTCQTVNANNHFDAIQVTVSNVPGARSYNIYAAPPGNGCAGPFGLAANLPVSFPVLNTSTNRCPQFSGNMCSLGHESIVLDSELQSPFTPNGAAAPGTSGASPPDGETAPVAAGLPNQNPSRGSLARGDRANENNCETTAGEYTSCPSPVTPGAVELYLPGNGCLVTGNGGDTYLFSGYQYNWVAVYEPPSNTCTNNVMGANGNSAYIGLVYAPGGDFSVTSPYVAEARGGGGLIADALSFSGTMPRITFSSDYAPVPPASRLTG